MAKRIRQTIPIDGREVDFVSHGPVTVDKALQTAGVTNAPSVVLEGEVVRESDYRSRLVPPTGLITNQVPMSKGAVGPIERFLLEKDVDLIGRGFLAEFPGRDRAVTIDPDGQFIHIRDFPLPDGFTPDYVDMVIVTVGYPEVPPAGVHVSDRKPEIVDQISRALGGHVFQPSRLPSSYLQKVEELSELGLTWVCFHYDNWSWRFNPRDLMQGDCLAKYIENVFAACSGGH